jgi:hypothetical protein
MRQFLFWQRWLLIVSIVIGAFGVLMALSSGTPLFDLFNRQIDPAFWSASPMDEGTTLFQQWVYGVLGATIAGWGISLAFIALYPFRKKEKWAWTCTATGILAWFVLDTALSVFYHVYFNVAFNMALMILAMPPLIATRKDFTG